ncbi:hypothetical protein GCM10025875_12380 [Litorihabitans aurantiacus]|uniref:DUF881 domain-containing protein n=2 Tax=Litorihabitans aurantiacus TaxID=1930061 RepID=A0AA37XD64_9MICO|nr:hypothetical protein GCM10025875_12380 [Litorihabitans aurantiacus]
MTLLREVTETPLDPAYAEVAARRGHTHARRSTRGAERVAVGALAVALGAGLVTAITALRAPTDVRDRARDLLVGQVQERSSLQDSLTAQNAELGFEISDLSSRALAGSDPALVEELEVLAVVSGTAPVTGPAYAITLSDSAQATQEPGAHPEEQVVAVDVQIVVNALRAGGAEAITVNGTRVSGSGAIRGAGQAVLIDLVPVTSPYEVLAIGDVERIRRSVTGSSAAAHLSVLRDRYRIGVTSGSREEVTMPAARTSAPRFAVPVGPAADDDTTDTTDGPDAPPAPPGAGRTTT